jgi:hypothetical protein
MNKKVMIIVALVALALGVILYLNYNDGCCNKEEMSQETVIEQSVDSHGNKKTEKKETKMERDGDVVSKTEKKDVKVEKNTADETVVEKQKKTEQKVEQNGKVVKVTKTERKDKTVKSSTTEKK